jgi:hypothetical protein
MYQWLILFFTLSIAQAQVVEAIQPKSRWDDFKSKLRINYFGLPTSPTFADMEKGDWDNGAIHPNLAISDRGPRKNHDTWPTNIWNQLSLGYDFGYKMRFIINPRWMIPLSHPVDMKYPEDRSLISLDDFLLGFQGVIYSSPNKKFNFWFRPAVRLPTSRFSRNNINGDGFGKSTYQFDITYFPTYDFNKTWQVGIFGQVRNWVFENRYNLARLRFYTAPYVWYALNETTRIQVFYENMIENNRRWKSINGKNPVYKDIWQAVMIGVNKDLTPRFNIYPYVGTFLDNYPITNKSLYLGAWISYAFL